MQVRDFGATLRARDTGAFERLLNYEATAYYLLTGKSTGKTKDYPEGLLLWHLQLAYLRAVDHPALNVLKADFSIVNEELGELSLSEFSKGVKDGSVAPDAVAMSKEYRLQGARKHIVKDFHQNLELNEEANYHEVVSKTNPREKDIALVAKKEIRKMLHTDPRKAYYSFTLEFDINAKGKKIGKKVPASQAPAERKTLEPMFTWAYDRTSVWDVGVDLEAVKSKVFNQPPNKPTRRRDSETGSDYSDDAPIVLRAPAPVTTRAGARPVLLPLSGSEDD